MKGVEVDRKLPLNLLTLERGTWVGGDLTYGCGSVAVVEVEVVEGLPLPPSLG